MSRQRCRSAVISLAALVFTISCGPANGRQDPDARTESAHAAEQAVAAGRPSTTSADARPRIVVLGDSLTAGLGLEPRQAYPALLQQKADAAGIDVEIVNAGVSGDTSAGGLRRLDWSIDANTRVLVVALGANDGLRGLPAADLRHNLVEVIEKTQAKGVVVVLAGMEAPPNLGAAYTDAFHEVYRSLAAHYKLPFVPFLLEGVAGVGTMNQADGIHPTAEGSRIVAANVWTVLAPTLQQWKKTR